MKLKFSQLSDIKELYWHFCTDAENFYEKVNAKYEKATKQVYKCSCCRRILVPFIDGFGTRECGWVRLKTGSLKHKQYICHHCLCHSFDAISDYIDCDAETYLKDYLNDVKKHTDEVCAFLKDKYPKIYNKYFDTEEDYYEDE